LATDSTKNNGLDQNSDSNKQTNNPKLVLSFKENVENKTNTSVIFSPFGLSPKFLQTDNIRQTKHQLKFNLSGPKTVIKKENTTWMEEKKKREEESSL